MCKKCGKEYNEKDNLNWSCRQHLSAFSKDGDFWWCCGKKGADAPGCKFSRHEERKDDEDEEDPFGGDRNKAAKLNQVKCQCCKQVGHKVDECIRDPNIRTKVEAVEEYERIQKMRDFRKLF